MEEYAAGERLAEQGPAGVRWAYVLKLTREQTEAYLKSLEDAGYSAGTVPGYRRALERLYRFLPEDKYIRAGTLSAWKRQLVESGYSTRTVNVNISAANGLVAYLGHRELQTERVTEQDDIQPELTRTEYLRLLSTARMLGKKREYLLVKVFGTTGLSVGDLDYLTAEAVQEGRIALPAVTVRLPKELQKELIHFLQEKTITAGPVFVTKDGKPQGRTVVTAIIKNLGRDARVSGEKANPRCLRKLYQTTQEGIRENLSRRAYGKICPSWWSRPMTVCWKKSRPPSAGSGNKRGNTETSSLWTHAKSRPDREGGFFAAPDGNRYHI